MPEKINIMVMAGTKDAANIIKKLKSSGNFKLLATTTTEYGAEIAKLAGADEVLSRKLDLKDIINLIKEKNITVLIDATHPFATVATKNAVRASGFTEIDYLRFERPREELIENNLIHKVFSFEEAALKALELTNGKTKILHLAGVFTLDKIIEKTNKDNIYARVLPSLDSIQRCLDLGLRQENIIAMQGTFSKEFNKALMEEYDVSLIITKESGATGGMMPKIDAALELGIQIVLVTRPEIPELNNKDVFTDLNEMISFILNR
ncbi:precorrin-6A reductase [Methanobacterium sp. ACI-7]|uniref:precorrin-6A reductase n=1 Tax=unclassified Methanobacterium TaxID=2627676 RepID=UPI0039C39776